MVSAPSGGQRSAGRGDATGPRVQEAGPHGKCAWELCPTPEAEPQGPPHWSLQLGTGLCGCPVESERGPRGAEVASCGVKGDHAARDTQGSRKSCSDSQVGRLEEARLSEVTGVARMRTRPGNR